MLLDHSSALSSAQPYNTKWSLPSDMMNRPMSVFSPTYTSDRRSCVACMALGVAPHNRTSHGGKHWATFLSHMHCLFNLTNVAVVFVDHQQGYIWFSFCLYALLTAFSAILLSRVGRLRGEGGGGKSGARQLFINKFAYHKSVTYAFLTFQFFVVCTARV